MSEGVSEQGGVCISDLHLKADRRESSGEECRVYVSFRDLKRAYDRVNREALQQVLRMYGVGSKLLNRIKSIYINITARVRVKGGENECFMIDSGLRQGRIMSPWSFNVYMDEVMKEVKRRVERKGVKFKEGG